MKKNEYMKPAMQVVTLKQHSHLLTGSSPVRRVSRVSNDDGLEWESNGLGGDDY